MGLLILDLIVLVAAIVCFLIAAKTSAISILGFGLALLTAEFLFNVINALATR